MSDGQNEPQLDISGKLKGDLFNLCRTVFHLLMRSRHIALPFPTFILLQDYFTLPRAHSVGRAGQLNYPKSRYYSWEIIDHRLIAFVTIDYNALDSDYNTTTPKLFRLVHNTFLCLILITLNSVRFIVLLLLYSCEYNHPRTLTSALSWVQSPYHPLPAYSLDAWSYHLFAH